MTYKVESNLHGNVYCITKKSAREQLDYNYVEDVLETSNNMSKKCMMLISYIQNRPKEYRFMDEKNKIYQSRIVKE